MTILNYSGRGRGRGGGGGRGGRGRGYHAGGRHPGGRWGGGGGGRFAAAAPAASSKWVRPKDSDVIEVSKPEPQTTIESKEDVDKDKDNNNDDLKPPTITKTKTTATAVMKKHGRNKLVLNSTVEQTKLKIAPPPPVVNQTTHMTMTRWGKHKLDLRDPNKILQSGVVGKGPSGGRNEVEEEKQGKTISHVENMQAKEKEGDIVHGVGINLRKVGSNKLVMPGKNSTSVERPTRVDQRDMKRQRADHHRHRSDPSAKRIKVAIKESDSHDDSADVTDLQGGSRETTTTTTTTEKLTDFAYRETRKVAQHGGSKKWSSSGGASHHQGNVDGPRSMGLVRVPQDQSKTPICASFLRGVQCTDKYCSKRHDVPPEFAIPICSFFQRQGQCLKGEDCKFRHIKVNQRALVCPNFALLGFCDDKDCVMKHVRQNTNRAVSNKNVAAAQAHRK
jgi:hypothetical protein